MSFPVGTSIKELLKVPLTQLSENDRHCLAAWLDSPSGQHWADTGIFLDPLDLRVDREMTAKYGDVVYSNRAERTP